VGATVGEKVGETDGGGQLVYSEENPDIGQTKKGRVASFVSVSFTDPVQSMVLYTAVDPHVPITLVPITLVSFQLVSFQLVS